MTLLEETPVTVPGPESRSFETYVRERSVALQRFAFLVTHHHEDARDAVQDALVGLYPRFAEVAARGDVDAYVHRSIVNASVTRWRKQRRSLPVADLPEPPARDRSGDGFADEIADADAAWRLCATLPPDQRAAVVLRFWSGHSFAEIADVLGCAEATARSHVHRALTKLRTRFVEEER